MTTSPAIIIMPCDMRRIVAIADLHCGHLAGLTPPQWQIPTHGGTDRRNALGAIQKEGWQRYTELVYRVGPVDLLIANGDLIDGRARSTGGTDLLTSDQHDQCEMAVKALEIWNAKKIMIAYGTAYHVGPEGEDWERKIADLLGAEIHSHPFPEVDGVIFDVKHHISASSVPHGRATPLARAQLWNLLWAERDEQPRAHVILRAHVHYYTYIGGSNWVAIIQPSLQVAHTKYGARYCQGTVDWGMLEFVVQDGEFSWKAHVEKLIANKTTTIPV